MKEALYKKYENTKAVGVYPLCNWGGIEVLDFEYGTDDYAIACFNFGHRRSIRRHKLHYTRFGKAYFRKEGRRYYLDNFMLNR